MVHGGHNISGLQRYPVCQATQHGSHGVVVVGHQAGRLATGGVLETGVVGIAEDSLDPRQNTWGRHCLVGEVAWGRGRIFIYHVSSLQSEKVLWYVPVKVCFLTLVLPVQRVHSSQPHQAHEQDDRPHDLHEETQLVEARFDYSHYNDLSLLVTLHSIGGFLENSSKCCDKMLLCFRSQWDSTKRIILRI